MHRSPCVPFDREGRVAVMRHALAAVAAAYLILLALIGIGNGITDPDCVEVVCSAFKGAPG